MTDAPYHCHFPMVLVTIQGYYDGGLCWSCLLCGSKCHRFARDDWRRPKAEAWARRAGVTLEEAQ